MLVCWVASSVRPPFGAHSQNRACKLSFPNIFVASVQLTVFISACLADNFLKMSHTLPSAWCRQEEHPFPLVSHLHRRFRTPGFFLVILNYKECFGLAVRRLSAYLFIYLFIHLLVYFFNFNFLLAVQLRYKITNFSKWSKLGSLLICTFEFLYNRKKLLDRVD